MSNEKQVIETFQNDEFGEIRMVMVGNEPWFVGKDVATGLGYGNPRDAINRHVDEEDKGVLKHDTLGRSQELTIINEPGLYSLIFGSKLDSAKRFKHWVTHDVLPAIRKTGSYSVNPAAEKYDKTVEKSSSRVRIVNGVVRFIRLWQQWQSN